MVYSRWDINNTGILQSGSEAQEKGDSRNHGLKDPT